MSELRIAVTGHRPNGLRRADGTALDLPGAITAFLDRAVARASAGGCDTLSIISGGALGTDQEVAEAVGVRKAELAAAGSALALRSVIALPFPPQVQGGRWPAPDLARLVRLVSEADEVVGPLYPTFSVGGLHARNHVMVDWAAELVAFWSGERRSGTFETISYALSAERSKTRAAKPVYSAFDGFRRLHLADIA